MHYIIGDVQSGGTSIFVESDGTLKFGFRLDGATTNTTYSSGTIKLELNTVYDITATYDGTTARIYLDGKVVAGATKEGTLQEAQDNTVLALGTNPNGNSYDGETSKIDIYSVKVYNRGLTQEEVLRELNGTEQTTINNIGIELSDSNSGLTAGATFEYGWSTSNTVEPTEWTEITADNLESAQTEIITPEKPGEDKAAGIYYLWVREVTAEDLVGNTYTTSLISDAMYFDEVAPTITVEPTEDTTWRQSHSVQVTIIDEPNGLATGTQIQYAWGTSNTEEPTSWTTVNMGNTSGAKTASTTITGSGLTGTYYLWIKPVNVKDTEGNTTTDTITTGEFKFDNIYPNMEIANSSTVVTAGLIRHFDALNNTGYGHSNMTSTWKDLS